MRKCGAISVVAAWCLVVVLVAEVAAADCNLSNLSPCFGVISGSPPSPECCNKLKEQEPCYCNYLKDPTLKPYIDSPIFKQLVATCGLTIPTC